MKTLRRLAPVLITILLTIGLLTAIRIDAGRAAPTGDLVTAAQTTIADFNQGDFYLTGMTRNGDGEVTLLQLGIAGEWLTRTNSTGLVARMEHASIAYNNRLYVFGGRVGAMASLRSIQFTDINTVTHNVSNWVTATTSLASSIYTYTSGGGGVAGLSAVQLNGRVYLLGGHDGSSTFLYNTVSFAKIDPATGQLGTLAATAPLPQGLSNGQAVVLNGRIYYMGGIFTEMLQGTNTVYYAKPDPVTGVIPAWYTTTAPLPYGTYGQMAVATVNGRIYSMAGISVTTFNGSVNYVSYAQPVATTGDIMAWVKPQDLQNSIFDGAAVTFGGQIYATGGGLDVYFSKLSDYVVTGLDALDTGVITWTSTSGITPSRLLHTAVVNSDGWLYIVGGSKGSIQPIQQNIINVAATTGQTGTAYASNGNFLSKPFDFDKNYIIHQIGWETTLPTSTTAALRYRSRLIGGDDTPWSVLYPSTPGAGVATTTLPITVTARYLQYQVFFTTTDPLATPILHQVSVLAEIPTPPTFQKSADPVSGSSVNPGDRITYTLVYSNVSDNVMTNIVIADPVPTTTTYVPGSIFGPVGVTTNDLDPSQLSWTIGTLPAHTGGTIGFVVTVNSDAPEGSIIRNFANFMSDQVDVSSNPTYHMLGLPPELVKSHLSSAPIQALGQVQPGDVVTYTLAYTNPNLSQPLLNTIITDSLPPGLTYLGPTGDLTPTVSIDPLNGQEVLQWAIGTVPALGNGVVGFYAQVVADTTIVPNGGSIVNTAFGLAGQWPFSSNTDSVPVRYRFDLMLSVDDGVTYVTEGSVLTYTIRITNVTSVPITPTGIVISDVLKPGFPTNQPGVLHCVSPCEGWAFDSVREDGSEVYSSLIPFLGPNQTTALTMVAQVSPTLLSDAPGVLKLANEASAMDDGQQGIEVDPLNQTAVDTDTIGLPSVLVKSHLSSAPAPALGQVQPGDIVTYTLVYMNPSLVQPLLNTIITDSLPPGLTYLGETGDLIPTVSVDPLNGQQVLQWAVGTVPVQTQGAVGFYARVVTDTTLVPNGGSIVNTAFGTADQGAFSSNTDSVPVRYRFDLMLSIDDGVAYATEGSVLTYTIRITNVTSMPITPTGIVISDALKPGFPTNQPGVLHCVSPCEGWAFDSVREDGSEVYSSIIPSLGPNQTAALTMVAQVSPTLLSDAPGVLKLANEASAMDDGQQGIEVDPLNQTAVDTDTVGLPSVLVKSHVSSAPALALGQVQPGDVVTYTLAYANPSLVQPLLNIIITDSLPPGLTYLGPTGALIPTVSVDPLNGRQVLQWAVGTVPAQAQGVVGFYARVVTDTTLVPNGGSIVNTAFGTTDQGAFSSNTDSVPVRYRFDLMLSIDDGVTKALPGSLLTYAIRITNVTSLPVTPTNISVYDYLEPGYPISQPGVLRCAAPCTGWAFDSVSEDGSQVYSRTLPFLGPNQSTVVMLVAQISPTLWTEAPGVLSVANKAYAMDDGQQGIEVKPLNQTAVDTDTVSGPDIVVTGLHAASSTIIPGKSAQFTVSVFNNGFITTISTISPSDHSGWFGVDLYVKPAGSPPPTGPADRYLGYCLDAPNAPCQAQIDHYRVIGEYSDGLAANTAGTATYTLSITPAGTYWLYAQADPYWAGSMAPTPYTAGTAAHGRIVEGNETNNISSEPIIVKVDYVKVYLPLTRK